jgi:hypothetical protein
MGFFNMLEMFFFVSLAITFVLILFLVYHFKQKFTALEEKCDTMFEIINNIVKEMNNRNNLVTHQEMPENVIFKPESLVNDVYYESSDLPKLVVSESEEDSEDEDSDDEDSEDEDSEDEDSDDEDESDLILPEEMDNDDKSIKVISVEINDIDETYSVVDENIISNDVSDIEDPDIEDGLDENNTSLVHVEKLEETSLENNNEIVESIPMDVYRKMNISALKALVIEKGYASDTNKMKKYELLQLLEASE